MNQNQKVSVGCEDVHFNDFAMLLRGAELSVDESLKKKIESSEKLLHQLLNEGRTIYGVNTGYGYNCTNLVEDQDQALLQENLVSYLRCGTGEPLTYLESKAVGYARWISISRGLSGVSYELIEAFQKLLNLAYAPRIPKSGSLGASGDLIPLAYWANFLMGRGEVVNVDEEVFQASQILKQEGLSPYKLKPKEGLSVVNGTSAMAGCAFVCFEESQKLAYFSAVLTAWALMALEGWPEAFSPLVNSKAKTFSGQSQFASFVQKLLKQEDYLFKRSYDVERKNLNTLRPLQDRYSVRCAPQIMGPYLDSLKVSQDWIEKEINGVSDNPLFDFENNEVAMGGNFYGGYMGLSMDMLKIGLVQLVDMVDRQLLLVMDPHTNHGLPANLVSPHLSESERNRNHGLKGLHQSASAITAEIAALSMPNTIFSRSSESHNQDKVSLGFSACKQYAEMIEKAYEVTALSLICFAQALDIRGLKLQGQMAKIYSMIRAEVDFLETDKALDVQISKLIERLKNLNLGDVENELFKF